MTIDGLRDLMIANFYDKESNTLRLNGLDFSQFDGNVEMNDIKVKHILKRERAVVGRSILQGECKAGGSILQGGNISDGTIFQSGHRAKEDIFQCMSVARVIDQTNHSARDCIRNHKPAKDEVLIEGEWSVLIYPPENS